MTTPLELDAHLCRAVVAAALARLTASMFFLAYRAALQHIVAQGNAATPAWHHAMIAEAHTALRALEAR